MEPIIIARAPLSINLIKYKDALAEPQACAHQCVVQAAIGYYAYTIVTPSPGSEVEILWAACPLLHPGRCTERQVPKSEFSLPEAIYQQLGIRDGLTVFLASQVPPGGGLNVRSSLAVSMIKALAFCSGLDLKPVEVAELASEIEFDLLKTSTTSIAHYTAASGGINSLDLLSGETRVHSLELSQLARYSLEKSLMLFRLTPPDRSLAGRQSRTVHMHKEIVEQSIEKIREFSPYDILTTLEDGNVEKFGQSLHHIWLEDHGSSGDHEDTWADECYRVAQEHGALGGWRESAVGYSFLTLCCREKDQPNVARALAELGMKQWPLSLVTEGVEVMEAMPRNWTKVNPATTLFTLASQRR